MAEGKITFAVGVEASDAISGLKKIQDEMSDMGKTSGKAGADTVDAFKDIDKAAKKSSSNTSKSATNAQKAMKKTAKVQKAAANDQIDGLDSLKESTGELDSSLKGLGGAVGLVSPEMEMLLMRTGDLSGGLEAGSRLTTLLGGSMRHLAIAGGTMGVAVAALVVGYKVFGGALSRAEDRMAAAHEEMEKGIKQANTYKFTVLGLKNQIGLLGDAEFAIIDARKKSKDAMAEEVAAQQGVRRSVEELKIDMVGLRQLEKDLMDGEFDHIKSLGHLEVQFRDITKMVKLTNEQIADGKPVLADNGLAWTGLTGHQIKNGNALKIVRAELGKTEVNLNTFSGQVEGTKQRTERLNLMLQIQAAQARDDTKAVRNLALNLAVLGDTESRLSIAALKAAEAMAIQQAQMAGLGPATAATIFAIQKLFDKMEDKAAPVGFATTLNQLNTTLDETGTATEKVTKATKDLVDVQAEIDAQIQAQAEAYANAQGLVALQVGDRQKIIDAHRDEKIKIQGFLKEELITSEQFSIKMVEIDKKKSDDLLANDTAVAQGKIATAEMFNEQIEALVNASR
ncbi:MAG TPA: hypothetical protein EYN66_14765, partial [Myxococcales bacterium]|nr:hypothetical protein [Myxococcales bacterium]